MTSVKYNIPLLDCSTRFSIWHVKMYIALTQMELDDVILGVDDMPPSLKNDERNHRDHKVLTQIHLHLSNSIL